MKIGELYDKSAEGSLIKKKENGTLMATSNYRILNWTKGKGLHYAPITYISKHLVNKQMWRVTTSSGKSITITEDHSIIVFRDGKQMEVRPADILDTDKVLVVK